MQDDRQFPKLIAFDLEYKSPISFYLDVPEILYALQELSISVALCSRTSAVDLAHDTISKLLLPPPKAQPDSPARPAIAFFDQREIYPGSKTRHFNQLHANTGIAYQDMLFFDDEYRNKEVEELGVTFILVERGMDHATFKRGVDEWRRRHPPEEGVSAKSIE
ncbi:magnesium-dependent phosphatase-1 [Cantharellus anzutake]|uniref:magnesium-dependent phosphatase-1 n=1 Tax=Cantharellus anzutake TaxID=1750568 RepID=UPI001907D52E|nr:magnesium-dependent phosphatase-1 [Cantharellus anzutake]KAF8324698.1 magnesium-dependent phosphatase-1 [Cantharellus anzutake]